MRLAPFLYIAISTVLMVTGQTLWKLGLEKVGGLELTPSSIAKTLTDARVFGGLVFYGLATLTWMKALSALPLSVVYPLGSFSYVLGSIVAVWLLGERYSWSMALGLALIIAGIALISRGPGAAT